MPRSWLQMQPRPGRGRRSGRQVGGRDLVALLAGVEDRASALLPGVVVEPLVARDRAGDDVLTVDQDVVAGTAVERVGTGPAEQHVVALAAEQRVVAVATDGHVVTDTHVSRHAER